MDNYAQYAQVANSSIAQLNSTISQKKALKEAQKDRDFNAEQAKIARDWQREEREATQAFNLDMWNRNNAYNSPAEQLKRMKEAGLNPNALGGGASVPSQTISSNPMSGASASTTASGGVASGLLTRDAALLSAMGQFYQSMSQSSLNKQQYDWNDATQTERYNALMKDNIIKDAHTTKLLADANLSDVSADVHRETISILTRKSEAELKLMNEQLNKLRNESLSIIQDTKYKKALTDTEKERRELVDAQTYESISRHGLQEGQMAGQELANEGKETENALLEIKKTFSSITGIPLDTPEFLFSYNMWKNGSFLDYVNHCINKFNENFYQTAGGAVGSILNVRSFNPPKTGTLNPRRR